MLLSAGALAGAALTGCGGHGSPEVTRSSALSRLACPASYPALPGARRVARATLVPPGAVFLVDCGYGYPVAATTGAGKVFPPGPRAGPRVSGPAVAGYVLLLDQQVFAAPGQVSCLRQLAGRGAGPRDVVLFGYPGGRVLTVAWDSYCSVAIGASGSSASLSSLASDSLTGLLAAFDATLAPAGHGSRPAPSLVGLPVTTAARLAGAKGFGISVSGELVQAGPPLGTVMLQTPPPGVPTAIPDELDLVVSVPPAAGCTAAQLRAVVSAGEPGAGTAFADLEIRDVGDEPCTLRGPLQVTALDARGQPLAAMNRVLVQGPLVLSPRAPARSAAGPATLTAEVGLSSTDYPGNCSGRIGRPSSWRITLADRSQLIASGAGRVPEFPPVITCGGHVGAGTAIFAAWSGP